MKKILIPTDFSDNSKLAVNYAAKLANSFGATLHLVHSITEHSSTGHLASAEGSIREDRNQQMESLLQTLRPTLLENVLLEHAIRFGYPADVVVAEADKTKADLIVMGTQGATGVKKWFVGSTTTAVLKNTLVPILAIPDEFTQFRFEKMTIALSSDKIKPTVLQPALDIAQKLGFKLDLLHIVNANVPENDQLDATLQAYLEQMGVSYTYHRLVGSEVDDDILKFVKDQQSDVLCVISQSEKRSWWQNLFHSSVSEEIAYRTEIPLLVLHSQE